MVTTRHRSLVERGERGAFVGDKGLAHTHKRNEQKRGGGKKNRGKNM